MKKKEMNNIKLASYLRSKPRPRQDQEECHDRDWVQEQTRSNQRTLNFTQLI